MAVEPTPAGRRPPAKSPAKLTGKAPGHVAGASGGKSADKSAPTSSGVIVHGGILVSPYPPSAVKADLRLLNGVIAEVGPSLTPLNDEKVLDAAGCVVLPGLVAAHTHLGLTPPPSTSKAADWWKAESASHDAASLYSRVLNRALDGLLRGVTGVVDLCPRMARGAGETLGVVSHALEEAGVRAVLSLGIRDDDIDHWAADLSGLREQLAERSGPFRRVLPGLWSPGRAQESTLRAVGDLVRRHATGVHVPMAEDPDELRQSEAKHGLGLIERLLDAGLLGPRSVLSVGAAASFEEIAVAREAGCWFAWSPRSVMALGRETPSVEHWPVDRIVLGTDCMDLDVLEELRTGWLMSRQAKLNIRAERMAHALTNGQRLAAQALGLSLGTFHVGAAADVAVFAYEPTWPLEDDTVIEHLIGGLGRGAARHVLVDGQVRVLYGRLNHPALDKVRATARDQAAAHRTRRTLYRPPNAIAPDSWKDLGARAEPKPKKPQD